MGDTKEVADPDSQRRGGGLALQAGGLPARHSMSGSACVCVCVCVQMPVCLLEEMRRRGMRGRRIGWVCGEKDGGNKRKKK